MLPILPAALPRLLLGHRVASSLAWNSGGIPVRVAPERWGGARWIGASFGMTWIDPVPALKRQLGSAIAPIVTGWYGDDIAYVLRTDRSRVAELRREKLDRFSLETLLRFLTRLGWGVEIKITPPSARARHR